MSFTFRTRAFPMRYVSAAVKMAMAMAMEMEMELELELLLIGCLTTVFKKHNEL